MRSSSVRSRTFDPVHVGFETGEPGFPRLDALKHLETIYPDTKQPRDTRPSTVVSP